MIAKSKDKMRLIPVVAGLILAFFLPGIGLSLGP